MLGGVWLVLIVTAVAVAGATGRVEQVTQAAMESARAAVETALNLAGVMALWLGLSRIAQESGLMQALARLLAPVTRRLFPSVPPDHPALGAVAMNLSANLLGLGNAATPMGLKAMQELQKLNRGDPEEATPAMCTFLVLNTSSVTLIPGTLIALRAAQGSRSPADIVVPTLVATAVSAAVGIAVDAMLRRRWARRGG
ncbi:nucleoside recognition domain-containing protein [Caldinitratiruptor microaerophilus]|uniref:Nucleoside recognition protein n=1 Tax=Caldinitratiruptor microaerophilus TaxID=671077 RepID=A0AA35G7K2_9FIRM|nr:nucleoside recognition domain-containing protein [Caldinitratiruptor microaerophilus]BDG59975.1 nucleoside recognition protein [Caldinitratiruptor microaerophilus]